MRIQIVVDDTYKGMLDELKQITGLNQWQDLFSDAITMYNWAVQQRVQGRIVASMNEKDENYREFQMTSLEHAAAYAKHKGAPAEVSTFDSKASVATDERTSHLPNYR
jgi:hypothetical protein